MMMSEQPHITGEPTAQPAKPPRPRKTINGHRLMQIGCLPFTLALTGCLLLFVNLVVVSRAPLGVSNPDEYVLGQRLVGSLGLLAGLAVIGTWLLGLMGAGMSAAAASGQGGMISQRLEVLRDRAAVAAQAVFLLRLMFLIALAGSVLIGYMVITDVQDSIGDLRLLRGIEIAALGLAAGTSLIHWLIGPFLRLRYSMALGVWGASWTRFRSRRVWMALTARMGAGMCGALTLFWGSALGSLIIATIRQPFSHSAALDFWMFVPFLPRYSWQAVLGLLGLSALIVLVMIGQLTLPPLYIWLARQRLASHPSVPVRGYLARFLSAPRDTPSPAPGSLPEG
jgi:hypothetical protein